MSRVRKAFRATICGLDGFEVVFAPDGKRAALECHRVLSDAVEVSLDAITVRRFPERDVVLPARSPIADTLTAEETQALKHAFGHCGDPVKAGYRDYYYSSRDDVVLCALTEKGLFSPMPGNSFGPNMTYFVLTDLGKNVALSITPEYRI